MKWNELTTLQKIATVTGCSSAFAGFVICLLDFVGILTDYFIYTTPLWCVFSLAVAHIEESYLGVRSLFLLFLQPQMVSRDSPPLPSRQAYVYYLSGMSG